MVDNHNDSIGCIVTECKYHCKNDDYCTLDQIQVGKDSSATADNSALTECSSFRPER